MERREDAEAYFSAVCDAGVASAVHYGEPPRLPFWMLLLSQGRLATGAMLDGCEDLPSVRRWMAHMEKHQVARDEHT